MFQFDLQRFAGEVGESPYIVISPSTVSVLQGTSIPATATISLSQEGYSLEDCFLPPQSPDWVSINGELITIAPTTDVTPQSYTFAVTATAVSDRGTAAPATGEFTVIVKPAAPTLTNFLGAWASAIKGAIDSGGGS